ncbi:hypothetical protein FQR65_LT06683 [Abscondita terminalis]|nr:hypothetical protein FQR65_LT06683 [Abscondita terminalis]
MGTKNNPKQKENDKKQPPKAPAQHKKSARQCVCTKNVGVEAIVRKTNKSVNTHSNHEIQKCISNEDTKQQLGNQKIIIKICNGENDDANTRKLKNVRLQTENFREKYRYHREDKYAQGERSIRHRSKIDDRTVLTKIKQLLQASRYSIDKYERSLSSPDSSFSSMQSVYFNDEHSSDRRLRCRKHLGKYHL